MKRIASLDLVRAVAIASVIYCHAVELFLPANVPDMPASNPLLYMAYIGSLILGRVGVPLFLFLTGYLLVSRTYTPENVGRFYKQHLLPLLIYWEVWVLILNIFIAFWTGETDLGLYLRNALFLEDVHLGIAWFVPMILGMYLFLPWVSMVLHKMRGKQLLALIAVVYVAYFVVADVGWFGAVLGQPLESTLDLSFGGGIYGLYIVLGYCFWRWEGRIMQWLRPAKRKIALGLGVLGLFVLTIVAQGTLHELGGSYFYWYQMLTLPVIIGVIFLLLRSVRVRSERWRRWLENVSVCAFGIFLVHQPLQLMVGSLLPVDWGVWPRVGVVWVASAALSLGIVTLARQISLPEVRRVVFYLK